jgi:hypothetical protein
MNKHTAVDFTGMRVNVLYESGSKSVNPDLCECKKRYKEANAEYCIACLRELTHRLRDRFFKFHRYAHGLAYSNYRCNCECCYYS